jgi:hypothetical protein
VGNRRKKLQTRFHSLYAYIENKILKEKKAEAAKILEQSAAREEVIEEKKSEKKTSCSCC